MMLLGQRIRNKFVNKTLGTSVIYIDPMFNYLIYILLFFSILSVGWWLLVLAYVKKIIKFLNRFRIHSTHIDSTTKTDRKTGKERHEVSENALNNADNDSKNCDNKSSNAELERVVKSSDNCSVSSLAQLSKSFLENNYSNNNKG